MTGQGTPHAAAPGRQHTEFHPGYIWVALATAIVAGFAIGAYLAFVVGYGFPLGAGFSSLIQVHGHVQLVGWAGLFIMGVSLYFIPRLASVPLPHSRWIAPMLWLMATGLFLRGIHTTDDTTKTTAGVGAVILRGSLKSGTTAGACGADANIVTIDNNGTTRFIFDAEGSGHADVEFTTFDKYDDLLALDQLQVIAGESQARLTPDRYGGNALEYNRERFESMGIVGKDSWHIENGKLRCMVNTTKLSMLHHGAILQLADRVLDLESENRALKKLIGGAWTWPKLASSSPTPSLPG